jgi:hypothetical protein
MLNKNSKGTLAMTLLSVAQMNSQNSIEDNFKQVELLDSAE